MNKGNRLIMAIVFTVLIILSGRLASAQDPLEVGPDIYKLLFENDKVRVMEIMFKPGDKIAMHSHPDHLAYIMSEGTLLLSYPDGTTKEMAGKSGDVFWINAEAHAAENIGTTEVKGLVVELKEQKIEKMMPTDSNK